MSKRPISFVGPNSNPTSKFSFTYSSFIPEKIADTIYTHSLPGEISYSLSYKLPFIHEYPGGQEVQKECTLVLD